MHEISYCDQLLQAVERRAGGRRVLGIRVRTGVQHRIVEASLQQAFDMMAEGTVAEGAVVRCIPDPFDVACGDCGVTSKVADALPSCPRCGGVDVALSGGNEVVLESIDLAQHDAPAGAHGPALG